MNISIRNTIVQQALAMAKNDMATNGGYINSPYRVMFDGEIYIARVRGFKNDNEEGGNISHKVIVEKPITYIGEVKL